MHFKRDLETKRKQNKKQQQMLYEMLLKGKRPRIKPLDENMRAGLQRQKRYWLQSLVILHPLNRMNDADGGEFKRLHINSIWLRNGEDNIQKYLYAHLSKHT